MLNEKWKHHEPNPFCQSMCHYCSFVKYVYNESQANEIEQLQKNALGQ